MSIKSIINKITGGHEQSGPIQPAILESPKRFPYGAFEFKTRIGKGITYDVEASSNLKNWASILTGQSGGEDLDYVDSSAPKFSHRFYRIKTEGLCSKNVVGYASIVVPPGFSMIANPFESAHSSVGDIFKDMPDETSLSKFDTRLSTLTENKVKNGKWTKPMEKMTIGEGGLFYNPTSDYKTLDFIGEVKLGKFSTPIPAGFSIRSSLVPQPGRLHSDLGFPATEGDVVHLFDRDTQKYVLYPFDTAKWASSPPVINVGESFWIAKKTAKNWNQNVQNI